MALQLALGDDPRLTHSQGWDLATFVATFGIVMDGDPLTSQLSIGCDGGMQVPNTGLNAHNKFETDSSMTRNDFYTSPTGDSYSVNATIFGYMDDYCNGDFTLGCMGAYMGSRYNYSKETNPFVSSIQLRLQDNMVDLAIQVNTH
jgi:hypothetical protein